MCLYTLLNSTDANLDLEHQRRVLQFDDLQYVVQTVLYSLGFGLSAKYIPYVAPTERHSMLMTCHHALLYLGGQVSEGNLFPCHFGCALSRLK